MSESESKEEQLSLDSVARLLLEECRMVLPGIQALFGFQLIAVFNEGFSDKLTPGEQKLHLAAIISTVVAIAAIMAPAALHRQLEAFSVSDRFIRIASRLLLLSMLPLTISLSLDVYLIAKIILKSMELGLLVAVFICVLLLSFWFGLSIVERLRSTFYG
jgi:Family of unknown function (DUF6328)